MPTLIKKATIRRARRLRRNMTAGELKLWAELQQFKTWYGVHFRKQAPVGDHVVDFVAHERKLVVEVDGEHHFSAVGIVRDKIRDDWLRSQGYQIVRLNTGELSDSFDGCIEEILGRLGLMQDTPTPSPSPQGGGELWPRQ